MSGSTHVLDDVASPELEAVALDEDDRLNRKLSIVIGCPDIITWHVLCILVA